RLGEPGYRPSAHIPAPSLRASVRRHRSHLGVIPVRDSMATSIQTLIEPRSDFPDASVDPTDVRNATVGSESRLDFFPVASSVPCECGIIKAIGVDHRSSSPKMLLCI